MFDFVILQVWQFVHFFINKLEEFSIQKKYSSSMKFIKLIHPKLVSANEILYFTH